MHGGAYLASAPESSISLARSDENLREPASNAFGLAHAQHMPNLARPSAQGCVLMRWRVCNMWRQSLPAVGQSGASLSARRHRSRTQGRYLPATGRLLACGGRAQVRGGPNGPANGSRRHARAFSEAQAAEHARGRKIYNFFLYGILERPVHFDCNGWLRVRKRLATSPIADKPPRNF